MKQEPQLEEPLGFGYGLGTGLSARAFLAVLAVYKGGAIGRAL